MSAAVGYSADQIIGAIGAALRAQDMPAVVGLLRMLAVKDPVSAETILAAIALLPSTDGSDAVEEGDNRGR